MFAASIVHWMATKGFKNSYICNNDVTLVRFHFEIRFLISSRVYVMIKLLKDERKLKSALMAQLLLS